MVIVDVVELVYEDVLRLLPLIKMIGLAATRQ
jgi:hypothetical protein